METVQRRPRPRTPLSVETRRVRGRGDSAETGSGRDVGYSRLSGTAAPARLRPSISKRASSSRRASSACSPIATATKIRTRGRAEIFSSEKSYTVVSTKYLPRGRGAAAPHGITRRLRRYVFTWSDDQPNKTWAIGSGCSTFYNTAEEADANTHMERDFANKSFVHPGAVGFWAASTPRLRRGRSAPRVDAAALVCIVDMVSRRSSRRRRTSRRARSSSTSTSRRSGARVSRTSTPSRSLKRRMGGSN